MTLHWPFVGCVFWLYPNWTRIFCDHHISVYQQPKSGNPLASGNASALEDGTIEVFAEGALMGSLAPVVVVVAALPLKSDTVVVKVEVNRPRGAVYWDGAGLESPHLTPQLAAFVSAGIAHCNARKTNTATRAIGAAGCSSTPCAQVWQSATSTMVSGLSQAWTSRPTSSTS